MLLIVGMGKIEAFTCKAEKDQDARFFRYPIGKVSDEIEFHPYYVADRVACNSEDFSRLSDLSHNGNFSLVPTLVRWTDFCTTRVDMTSFLRKRILGSPTPSPASTPRESTPDKAEELRLAPASKIVDSSHKKRKHGTRKRRNGVIFGLGGLFGIVVAGFFARQSDLIEFPEFGDLSMDSLIDVLPAGFMREARDLVVSLISLGLGKEYALMRNSKVKGMLLIMILFQWG